MVWLFISVASADPSAISQYARNEVSEIDGQKAAAEGEPDYLRDGDFTTVIHEFLGAPAHLR